MKSPGVPGERPLVEEARAAGDPGLVGARARLAAARADGARASSASPARTASRRPQSSSERSSARRERTWRSRATSARRSPRSHAAGWVVCEVSSFQLEDVHEFACDVAVLLNLEPDHLDRHGTFEAYRAAKLRIFERASVAVVPRGLRPSGDRVRGRRPAPGRAADPRRAQPRERRRRDGRRSRGGHRRRRDRRGAADVPRDRAPPRAGRRGRWRPVRERLEGDERRGRAAGARRPTRTSRST